MIFTTPDAPQKRMSVQEVCEHLDIHWYRPKKLTQGLRVAYLRSQMAGSSFFAKFNEKTNSQNIQVSFQDDTHLPFDEAA
ncbi:hypothetical protein F4054_15085 [Candidatus Poribacteria bacterium]|nr:hypothetical protein [Candidatus Poribacteria bacterium]MYK23567.1 hypothetical protein [Candidatus Poribacteria bacterium]